MYILEKKAQNTCSDLKTTSVVQASVDLKQTWSRCSNIHGGTSINQRPISLCRPLLFAYLPTTIVAVLIYQFFNHFKLLKLQSSKKTKNKSTINSFPYSLGKRSIKKSFRINSWPSAPQATCCQPLLAYQTLLHHRFARWTPGTHVLALQWYHIQLDYEIRAY